ncbi:MAG: HD domain-containing protein [Ruminococcus sp.]|nr:HD domain-containing protein [Ruminococcus sp.]
MATPAENKQRFIEIFNENIKRAGADQLLEWLDSPRSDFFTAPASTRFHSSYEGGLLQHSLNVYDCLKAYLSTDMARGFGMDFSDETIAIVALLHDICKVNLYRVSYRNKKNDETGQWEKVPFYEFHEMLPYGHGEKSVYIVSGFMKLSRDEAMAIRWHMGFSGEENVNTIGNAMEMYPLALAMHIADMNATFLLEGKPE